MTNDRMYKLIRLFILFLGYLPRGVTRFAADGMGMAWYHLDRHRRTIVIDNLTHAYGKRYSPEVLQSLARRIFKNICNIVFDVAWAYRLKDKDIPAFFSVEGLEHLEAGLKKGHGVLMLCCHMGSWELMATGFALVPYKPFGIYRRLDFAPLDKLILEFRERFGTRMIPLRGAGKKINALLRKGEIVGTLLDQSVDWYEGVFVDFFGRRTCTNKGVAVLARRTRAAVVPMYLYKKNGRFIIRFEKELPLQVTDNRIKDIEVNTQTYMNAIETIIRRHPEHWFWVHNRWKTRPYCLLERQGMSSTS